MPPATDDNPDPDQGWARVAARLEQEIQHRGISKARLARESGVSPQTITKLLAGEAVTRTDRLATLARYLGWPAGAFESIRAGDDPHGPVQVAASGADLEALRAEDPDAYDLIQDLVRAALDRARRRSQT